MFTCIYVLGIASPNRRPTIFDVFRPRPKTEIKKKDRDAAKASGSDQNNSSGSGSVHSGSGGIIHTVKAAVQNTIGHRHGPTDKPKFRDGSAHPHAGSDAQVISFISSSIGPWFTNPFFV